MSTPPPENPRYWLTARDQPALQVRERGLLFGRDPDCDVVLDNPRTSKHHALVRPARSGLELYALGRNPTQVNGRAVEYFARLVARDRLSMPGGSWRVMVADPVEGDAIWQIRIDGGGQYGLGWFPLSVGGGAADHIRVEGWPPATLRFSQVGETLALELGAAVMISGEPQPAGAVDLPRAGDRFERDRVSVLLLSGRAERRTTVLAEGARLPLAARFEFLPNGGRLTLVFPRGRTVSLELPELRGRLVAALMAPPRGYTVGDWIPDAVLIPAVWSANSGRGRTDLNLLLHHTRKALLRAGVEPSLLARARRGGGTCLRLASGATVAVC